MSRLKIALGIFVVSAFIALGLGVSQAQAGVPTCEDEDCTIVCADEPGDRCDGDEGTQGNDVVCGRTMRTL